MPCVTERFYFSSGPGIKDEIQFIRLYFDFEEPSEYRLLVGVSPAGMMSGKLLVILLFLYAGSCDGQKFSPGACPTVTPMGITLLNPGLIGDWFEHARTFNVGEHGWKCVSYTFATITQGVSESITVRGIYKHTGTAKTATGTVTNSGPVAADVLIGTLSVLFSTNRIFGRDMPVTYTVVGRDANAAANWITLYGCRNVGLGKLEYVVILTKVRMPTVADINSAFAAAAAAGVPASLIKKTNQSDC